MPKWTNRGHEFDELGNYFKEHNEILIVGDNKDRLIKAKNKLDFLAKKGTVVKTWKFNKPVYRICKLFKIDFFKNKTVVVLNCNGKVYNKIRKIKNVVKDKNLFWEGIFFEKYLQIFAVYTKDLVYSPHNSFICTTICNLNCKSCLNFTPYNKNKRHYDIEELKRSVDTYFNAIDRVGLFHISGGEPQLYPNIIELIEYINSNYKDKIETLGMVTNAFVVPSDKLCETLKRCNVQVGVDDYRKQCPNFSKNFEECLEKFKRYEINLIYQVKQETEFFVLYPLKYGTINPSQDELEKKFCACANPFTEIKNGKLYNCNWAEFAMEAGFCKEEENDFYDLRNFTLDKKKELVEYRLGYTTKGYVEFCRHCNGSYNMNHFKEPAALQAKGLIEWEK